MSGHCQSLMLPPQYTLTGVGSSLSGSATPINCPQRRQRMTLPTSDDGQWRRRLQCGQRILIVALNLSSVDRSRVVGNWAVL